MSAPSFFLLRNAIALHDLRVADIRWTGALRWQIRDARWKDAYFDAHAERLDVRLGFDKNSLSTVFDTRFDNLSLTGRRPFFQKTFLFKTGKTRFAPGANGWRITLSDWTSDALDLGGEVLLTAAGGLRSARIDGELNGDFLKSIIAEEVAAALPDRPRHRFEVKAQNGLFELDLNGKPLLKSQWTLASVH